MGGSDRAHPRTDERQLMFLIVEEGQEEGETEVPVDEDVVRVLARYDNDEVRGAQDAAEAYALDHPDAGAVTVWTVPHVRTFRFRQEMRLRLIDEASD